MVQNIDQQIFDLVKKSGKILVVLPENFSADIFSAGMALRLFLLSLQKDAVVASSGKVPDNLKFLPGVESVQTSLGSGKSLVISVDTKQKKIEEISYHTETDKAKIYIKSKNEPFEQADLTFAQEKLPVDLMFCLGGRSLDDFGKIREVGADIFFETPKINIDNSAANEYFGQVNLVDLTATSVSEILSELLQKYEEQILDENIATCLLAGIIANTNSFQHAHTTPKAFLKAGELVALGGRQQEIVKNIFKTKSLPVLKLWGRALARMKVVEPVAAVYSMLSLSDFEKAQGVMEDVVPVLKELVSGVSAYNVVGLLVEQADNSAKLLLAAHEQISMDKFMKVFPAGKILDAGFGNYKIAEFIFDEVSLEFAESKFLESLKS